MPEFVKVARVSDLDENACMCVEVGGRRVALYRLGGEYFATDDSCTHAEASLSEGMISGEEIVCPLHFATFNIRTGACTGRPAAADLATYPVRVTGADIEIAVEA